MKTKDPRDSHFYISMAKSSVRIAAGVWLMIGHPVAAGVLLILAEVLGIVEEF